VNDSVRRPVVVVGAIMLAAALAVGAYAYITAEWEAAEDPGLRRVEDLLSDCHAKMEDLQRSLDHA
jgi:hypothetical protein